MRILIANWHRQIVGGVETYLQTLIPVLSERGHQVSLLHGSPPSANQTTIDHPAANIPSWDVRELGIPKALESIAKWQPDLVFVHGLSSADLEGALLERYPAALFAHNYYGTCATGRKCHASPTIEQCTRTFGPMCLALHYPRRCGGLSPISMFKNYLGQSKRNAFLFRYRSLIVASNHMFAEYVRHGIPQDRLHLAPLPTTSITPIPAPLAPREINGRMLFMGRLTDIKGVDYLLKALGPASHHLGRALTLTILGDGPERDQLENLARQLGAAVEFTGHVEPARRNEFMRASDLLVIPSLWPEPFGLVGIEAGCVGLPAVGYAVGGIPDWLVPGKSGELAPGDPPTVRGLADAITRALRDPGHYNNLRRRAWEIARTHSMEGHMKILEPILFGSAVVNLAQPATSSKGAPKRFSLASDKDLEAPPAPMGFLFVSAFDCDENTGAAGSLLAIGAALRERGHKVDYLWNPSHYSKFLHPSLDRLFGLPRRQYQQVEAQLRHAKYDVVIVSQPYAFLIYERLVKKYPGTLFLNRTHGWEDRVYHSKRQLHWEKHANWLSGVMAQGSSRMMRRWCRRTALACHGLISPASPCADYVVKTYQVAPDKVTTIGYGVGEEYLQNGFAEKSGAGNRMLFVGQYLPKKGIDILESVLPSLGKDFATSTLTFVVPPDAVSRIRARFGPAFGSRLTVHSWMERRRLIEIYKEHDIFLFPSLFEGFGKTVLEAMACGMCVVGFDEGVLPDIATAGRDALICEPGDSVTFRRMLEQCLSEPSLTREIGERATALVQEFSWSRTAKETENFCLNMKSRNIFTSGEIQP
jgi:glycosyltransferase involved in cell wall biosynthesis